MTSIELLIFDEAHHCRKRHPYAQVMDHYRKVEVVADRPRIFGMTASPVNLKLSEDAKQAKACIVEQVRQLEAAMHAKVVTIADLTEVQSVRRLAVLQQCFTHPEWTAAASNRIRENISILWSVHGVVLQQ
jgi:endoribonuclease Dicer